MANIRVSFEGERGCGYRSGGGLYLMTDPGELQVCGRLPHELEICPTCGGGIHFSRSWTWVNPKALFKDTPCKWDLAEHCPCACPLSDESVPEKAGLLWIGRASYGVREWLAEAVKMGVSRRIPSVPRGFEVGKTLVLVAHLDTNVPVKTGSRRQKLVYEQRPAIFTCFTPQRIEYVVKGDETEDELDALEKRGLELVEVVPVDAEGRKVVNE